MNNDQSSQVLVIGAGPAGLTAAHELACKHGKSVIVLEADSQVGGISRTVVREDWRFDIGGHRFFTKVERVRDFWEQILPEEDFLIRPRMSRIFYNGKFFDYPLKAFNALKNLGVLEAILCVASYVGVRIVPPKDQSTFEGWVSARFGWRLYRTFFKTYTEKVWGVPANKIQADWAAQRIKNLSLSKAIINSIGIKWKNSTKVTSLIEHFHYPKLGPGMMWEQCASEIVKAGGTIHLESEVSEIRKISKEKLLITTKDLHSFEASRVISTMPINKLVEALAPSAPEKILLAARSLKHRDFMTVALVVPFDVGFPDNWIYVHDPKARVGRIQNFGSWSPFMVRKGTTCLGLEYFVNEGDDLWDSSDDYLIEFASRELQELNLVRDYEVSKGWVV